MDQAAPDQVRISLTLPGSASLGAFQAGGVAALAELIRALRQRGIEVHVDAVGGSSAGSFVAMLFSHCLLTGRDSARLLADAWIDEIDIDLLRSGGGDSPLDTDRLRPSVEAFLEDESTWPYRVHEPLERPIVLQIGLTSLLGLTAPVPSLDGTSTSGLTYADWVQFNLEPGHDHRALIRSRGDAEADEAGTGGPGLSVLDAVLASATHPGGFPPVLLDRSNDRQVYQQRGVTNFPDHGQLWYTDGGLVESQPVGRVIEAANRANDRLDARRLHLVVDPRSSGPSATSSWSADGDDPSWLDGLRRSASIVPTQALHDDLRRVATVNERLAALDDLVEELADQMEHDDQPVDRSALRTRFGNLGGLNGKLPIDIDMISPLLLTDGDGDGVTDLLAGDFIAAFGGFLDARIRRSDFALGWSCTERWCEQRLPQLGFGPDDCDAIVDELREARPTNAGRDGIIEASAEDQLSRRGRWQLALLAAQYGRVLVQAALPSPDALLDRWRSEGSAGIRSRAGARRGAPREDGWSG